MNSNQKARKEAFENELRGLLKKHDAEICYEVSEGSDLSIDFNAETCREVFFVDFSAFDLG